MKYSRSLPLLLGFLFLLPSCHTWGPNQRAGTVTGAAIGSGVGAIVGSTQGNGHRYGRYGYYNGGNNTAEGALIGLAAGAIAGNLIGAHVDRHQYPQGGNYYAPPPPAAYAPPPPYVSTTRISVGTSYGGGYPRRGYGSWARPYYGRGYGYGYGYGSGRRCYYPGPPTRYFSTIGQTRVALAFYPRLNTSVKMMTRSRIQIPAVPTP